jgi:hypothetical protein
LAPVQKQASRRLAIQRWRGSGALDQIAARQRAADEKRLQEIERQQQAAMVPQSAVVQ